MVELNQTNYNDIVENYKKSEKLIFNEELEIYKDENKSEYFLNNYVYEDIITNVSNRTYKNENYISKYQQINNEYLITNDECYLFPAYESVVYGKNNSSSVQSTYDVNVLLNSEIQYPLTAVNESLISDDSSSIIRDKYITVGKNGSTESSALLAGTDRLQFVDQNNLTSAQYITIIEIDMPYINSDCVVSSNFHISKNTTTTNSNRNPNITINKITSDIEYDYIEGTTSFNRTLLGSGLGTLKSYTFDITDSVVSSINSSTKLLLTIEGSLSGYASFYSTNSNSVLAPYLSIEVTSNELGGTLYGDAPVYTFNNSPEVNCFGYALLENQWVTMSLTSKLYTNVYNTLKNAVKSYGYEIREIDSYDSDISSDERRIAFRYDLQDLTCWHFVLQTADGSWAAKIGVSNSESYPINVNPNSNLMWQYYTGLNNEITYYYAIK